jgi:hypothetical protein
MTVAITPSASTTPFDHAVLAACRAGWWPPEVAFTACCVMRGHGMTDVEIEAAFADAKRRVQ